MPATIAMKITIGNLAIRKKNFEDIAVLVRVLGAAEVQYPRHTPRKGGPFSCKHLHNCPPPLFLIKTQGTGRGRTQSNDSGTPDEKAEAPRRTIPPFSVPPLIEGNPLLPPSIILRVRIQFGKTGSTKTWTMRIDPLPSGSVLRSAEGEMRHP